MAKRTGLGRGIGALIPTGDQDRPSRPVDVFFDATGGPHKTGSVDQSLLTVPGARLVQLDPECIHPNAQQPRKTFDPDDLAQLVHSVREFGVLQPIVVRPHPSKPEQYELVMGERRLRATKAAGLAKIPAVVKDTASEDMLRDALLENLHRSELNPLEEASAYQQLLEDFGITQDQLAARIGRSRPQISNTIRLLKLPEAVQLRVASGVLTAGHARAILSLDDPSGMAQLADKIVNEDLSVRATEEIASARPRPQRAKASAGKRNDYLNDVAARLGDRLDTRVRISLGAKKGQVTIDFATIGDLNRILTELGEQQYSS